MYSESLNIIRQKKENWLYNNENLPTPKILSTKVEILDHSTKHWLSVRTN